MQLLGLTGILRYKDSIFVSAVCWYIVYEIGGIMRRLSPHPVFGCGLFLFTHLYTGYLIVIIQFYMYQHMKKARSCNMDKELWDIYDSCFQKTGKLHVRGDSNQLNQYHLVVHIYPVNKNKELLVQKRSSNVEWFPDMWAATGGSAVAGEDVWEACRRELYEELGIMAEKESSEMAAIFKRTDSFNAIWIIKTEAAINDLILQEDEVAEAKWMYPDEIRAEINKGNFHKYSYMEWLFDYLEKMIIK